MVDAFRENWTPQFPTGSLPKMLLWLTEGNGPPARMRRADTPARTLPTKAFSTTSESRHDPLATRPLPPLATATLPEIVTLHGSPRAKPCSPFALATLPLTVPGGLSRNPTVRL